MGAWRNTQFLGPNGTEVNADLLSLVSSCVRSGSFDYEQLLGSWEALKRRIADGSLSGSVTAKWVFSLLA